MRTPGLTPLRVLSPVKLQRALQLATKPTERRAEDHLENADLLQLARAALARLKADPTTPLDLRTAKALVSLAAVEPSAMDRKVISELVLRGQVLPWRHHWLLWVACHGDNPRVARELAARLGDRIAVRPKFAAKLPAWLPRGSAREIQGALDAPETVIRDHITRTDTPIWGLHDVANVRATSELGVGLARELALRGDEDWWRSMTPATVRAWASGQMPAVLSAVADRYLVELGAHASSPTTLPTSPDRALLKAWVLHHFGDPALAPGRWGALSPRAREVFEWLLVGDEISKIFQEFRQSAESDRAAYWERFLPQIRDARYYEATTTSVCMMVIGSALVIEFGRTGNACYFYQAPSIPLRAIDIPPRAIPKVFKAERLTRGTYQEVFRLGQSELRYLGSKSHIRGLWQGDFDKILVQVDAQIPAHRRYR
ncbi:MAG: hypothetical protein H6716_29815 [Polyangiaceae bacterium]|nr:hypothetical protein [Polyangiaceae bacterium]